MNTTAFIFLVALVALTRFFKGMFSRTKNENTFTEEMGDFMIHTIIVFVVYTIVYAVLVSF